MTEMKEAEKIEVKKYLEGRIATIKDEIAELQKELPTTLVLLPDTIDENGAPVSAQDLKRNPGRSISPNSARMLTETDLVKSPISVATKEEPSPWTKA